MKAVIAILSIFFVLILGAAGIGIAAYVTNANYGNEQENIINTAYENDKSILGQYSLKVKEAAKVSDKYSEALTEMISGALSSRYGDEGSKAAMQWITEQNPNLDPQVYVKIQQIIESGRNEYQVAQTTLLDPVQLDIELQLYVWV